MSLRSAIDALRAHAQALTAHIDALEHEVDLAGVAGVQTAGVETAPEPVQAEEPIPIPEA